MPHEIFLLGDGPMRCPYCQSRTDFEDYGDGHQLHTCLRCPRQFVAEPDEDYDYEAIEE